jgi:manganese/iron transport system permease protein/iron/zinc/copper transport system permease protein
MNLMEELWRLLIEPLTFGFLQRALLGALLVGAMCGLVGVYVVLRRMSYIGHGLSYAIFGGAVVSTVLQINFYLGATAWGFLAALLIIWTSRKRIVGADAAIGIITTASFAIGVIVISVLRDFRADFDAALFGNILSIREGDLIAIVAVAGVIAVLVFVAYKQLLFTAFDPEVAGIYGVRTGWIDALFALMLAALIIVAMQVVGVTLIAASLITPPTIARLLTNSFPRMMLISTLVGAFGGVVGVYASWYLDWATGATIVMTHASLFVIALVYSNLLRPRLLQRARPTGERPAPAKAPPP